MAPSLENQIVEALTVVVDRRRDAGPEALGQALSRLDELSLDAQVPPALQHYLVNRSYAKALLWLQGQKAPGCGR